MLVAGLFVCAGGCGKSQVGAVDGAGGRLTDASVAVDPPGMDAGGGAADGASADAAPVRCPDFAPPGAAVTVQSPDLVEASGVVASQLNPGVLWSHNDSGDSARIFALRADGSSVGVIKIKGAGSVDWEDIAIGRGPDGKDALFLGDIGDNDEQRPSVFVYRVAEPNLASAVPTEITDVTAIELVYDDGKGHNAEALIVDPRDGSLVIVTKVSSGDSAIYAAAPPFVPGQNTLKKVGSVKVGVMLLPGSTLVTAASISRAGDLILLRTYTTVLGFPRGNGQSIASALGATACSLPTAFEMQGEAITLAPDSSGFYTLSEGASPPLSFSKRR